MLELAPTVRDKTFQMIFKVELFLNNSRMTKPNEFKFGTVVEYHVPNKLQVVLLHNLDLFPCY